MEVMATSGWKDECKVNVKRIDIQHRLLLKLIDNIHEGVEARIEKNVLENLLIELAEFSRMHFLIEEQLMKEHGFPDVKKHHEEHRSLLEHLDELVSMVSNGNHPTSYSDYDISTDWALVHIAGQDNTLGAFLNSKGIN